MQYYSEQEKLIMPEYGRNVQSMVEYAMQLEDKEERNNCVQAIMQTMGNLFPYLRNEESRHKIYDHLAIMSNFQLDIDCPYERPHAEELCYKPEPIPYSTRPIQMRHYGRIIEAIIAEAIRETDEEKKRILTRIITARMRLSFILWNKDTVEEARIREDLDILSQGQLTPYFEGFETLAPPPKTGNPNKRKWK